MVEKGWQLGNGFDSHASKDVYIGMDETSAVESLKV